MICPSSTPLSFIDLSACCVHTLRPITFRSIIFLKFSGEPSAGNKSELVLWNQLLHPYCEWAFGMAHGQYILPIKLSDIICGAYGWGEGVYSVLVWKPEGEQPLGRPRRRWVYNIRTDFQEVGCGYLAWIALARDKIIWRSLLSAVMNILVPWNSGNFLTSCKPVSFSRWTLHHGVSILIFILCSR